MAVQGIQGQGVLVNLFNAYGGFPRKEVGYDDLMRIMEKDEEITEEGDILCIWNDLERTIMEEQGQRDP